MRNGLKWVGRALLALALALVVVGTWKRKDISRLMTVNSLFEADKIVGNFSGMDTAFLNVPVPRGPGPMSELPTGPDAVLPDTVATWRDERDVTSLLVVHKGQVVFEDYYLGTTATDRRISWSVAKSYLSALFGIIVQDGAIASLDDLVTDYVPSLKGSAYDRATVRNVLQMSSGVTFDEDYLAYNSDINKMGRLLALGGSMDGYAIDLKETFQAPGVAWKYVSIDTHVLGMVIRGATGRSVPELLSEKILSKLGMEQDAYYLTDGDGVAFVLGGLNITTRDYARFGLMIKQNGFWNGQQIVPADWVAESTAPSAKTEPDDEFKYGYQWWIPRQADAGVFMGRGIYGQYVYIDQQRDVVIVTTAADRNFREDGVSGQNVEIFRQIAASLEN
ncbi:MAG: serine hydrolase [Aliishimia sp.]